MTAVPASRVPAWAVFLLLASLAGLLWLEFARPGEGDSTQHHGHAHEDPDIARGRKVLTHPLEEVRHIVIARGGNSLRLRRAGPRHAQLAPGTWLAESGSSAAPGQGSDDMAMRIAAFSRLRMEKEYPLLPDSEREFGLAGDRNGAGDLEVKVVLADGGVLGIRFGDLAPDGISRYVRLSEPAVLATVPDFHYRNLVELAAALSVR